MFKSIFLFIKFLIFKKYCSQSYFRIKNLKKINLKRLLKIILNKKEQINYCSFK